MDDSIIAIVAAVAIGIFQLVVSINKKKKEKQRIYRSWSEEENEEAEVVEEEVVPYRALTPQQEGGPMVMSLPTIELEEKLFEEEEETLETEGLLLQDFTPQKAIIFSEVLHQRWNS